MPFTSIVEHPFGTIKRQWGFNYVLSKKGMNRAGADVGLMMTAYNLRRIINILGIKDLRKYLVSVIFSFSGKKAIGELIEAVFKHSFLRNEKLTAIFQKAINELYLYQIQMNSGGFWTDCCYQPLKN